MLCRSDQRNVVAPLHRVLVTPFAYKIIVSAGGIEMSVEPRPDVFAFVVNRVFPILRESPALCFLMRDHDHGILVEVAPFVIQPRHRASRFIASNVDARSSGLVYLVLTRRADGTTEVC